MAWRPLDAWPFLETRLTEIVTLGFVPRCILWLVSFDSINDWASIGCPAISWGKADWDCVTWSCRWCLRLYLYVNNIIAHIICYKVDYVFLHIFIILKLDTLHDIHVRNILSISISGTQGIYYNMFDAIILTFCVDCFLFCICLYMYSFSCYYLCTFASTMTYLSSFLNCCLYMTLLYVKSLKKTCEYQIIAYYGWDWNM